MLRKRYPPGVVTRTLLATSDAGLARETQNSLRRCSTYVWSVVSALAGGSWPHNSWMRAVTGTVWLACNSSSASTERGLGAVGVAEESPQLSINGPRTRISRPFPMTLDIDMDLRGNVR